jgi:integrase
MLPLSDFLRWLMQRRYDQRTSDKFVFPGHGTTGHITKVRTAVAKVTESSGVSVTVHDLRRTFITCAEALDISPYTLKKLMNHRVSGDVTAGYLVITAERLREAMQRITDAILEHAGVDKDTLPWKAVERNSKIVSLDGRMKRKSEKR